MFCCVTQKCFHVWQVIYGPISPKIIPPQLKFEVNLIFLTQILTKRLLKNIAYDIICRKNICFATKSTQISVLLNNCLANLHLKYSSYYKTDKNNHWAAYITCVDITNKKGNSPSMLYHFSKECVSIRSKICIKVPMYSIIALCQIMVWDRPGDKPLSQPMMVRSLMHICVTQRQWVKMPEFITSLLPSEFL